MTVVERDDVEEVVMVVVVVVWERGDVCCGREIYRAEGEMGWIRRVTGHWDVQFCSEDALTHSLHGGLFLAESPILAENLFPGLPSL